MFNSENIYLRFYFGDTKIIKLMTHSTQSYSVLIHLNERKSYSLQYFSSYFIICKIVFKKTNLNILSC